MKVQCPCGGTFDFEIQPEMLVRPGKFVCAQCQANWSDYVNVLILKELMGADATPSAADSPSAPPARSVRLPLVVTAHLSPPPAQANPCLAPNLPAPLAKVPAPAPKAPIPAPKIPAPTPKAPAPGPPPAPKPETRFCAKHPDQTPAEKCVVCRKPICPECMELFGYVCSPFCLQKAEAQGIEVPEYLGQKSATERRLWQKPALLTGLAAALVLSLFGGWAWYAWVGSQPRPAFTIHFAEPSFSGRSYLCGQDQIVFLHGETLARHDLKTKQQIWSSQLCDRKTIDREIEATMQALRAAQIERNQKYPGANPIKFPDTSQLAKRLARAAAQEMKLHIRGQKIWVASPGKLVRYDWDTGKPAQEVLLGGLGGPLVRGHEIISLGEDDTGRRAVIRVNLVTGQKRLEEMNGPSKTGPGALARKSEDTQRRDAALLARAGLTLDPVVKFDPDKIATHALSAPMPGRIGLLATLGTAHNQDRAADELQSSPSSKPTPPPPHAPDLAEHFTLVPGEDGFAEISVSLLEEKLVARSTPKAAPKKSAFEGDIHQPATMEIAHQSLNDMNHGAGDDFVLEDESRYAVAVRLPCVRNAPEWRGETIGAPVLIQLRNVNLIAAGKNLTILDKANQKKWTTTLTYPLASGVGSSSAEPGPFGFGPCVERGDTLYVIDQGVLSAFDLASGNPRWRVPSVGIAGIFFDDDGMIYVNTTTASPEKLRSSKPIEVTDKVSNVALKLDPKTGKTLWNAELGGLISYLSGKFIYTTQGCQPDDSEDEHPDVSDRGSDTPPHMRIKRINPGNGKVMWAYFQERAPLSVQFDRNTIQLVFKKEVQVLKFLAF